MKIQTEKITEIDSNELFEITLISPSGMQVVFLNYGASIEKFLIPTETGLKNMVLSLPEPVDYLRERTFLGAAIGRVAGRIRQGQWASNNQLLQLEVNEGRNHLHGGFSGFDTAFWDFETTSDEVQASVTFTRIDKALRNGYPGNLTVSFQYTLAGNELTLEIRAQSDERTLFNPTNHVYFNLSAEATIENHWLAVNSNSYLPLDAESLPTGEVMKVTGTAFDFRASKKLGDIFVSTDEQLIEQAGLNHPFLLEAGSEQVVLSLPKEKRSVAMTTSAPSVIIYSGNHFGKTPIAGHDLPQYAGIALEAQFPPTADNQLNEIVLEAATPFYSWTKWKFETTE